MWHQKLGRNLNWESILIPETVSCLLDSSDIESIFSVFPDVAALYVIMHFKFEQLTFIILVQTSLKTYCHLCGVLIQTIGLGL